MPRQGRLDFPGALQHVMVRGQERRRIFHDKTDYQEFKRRLGARLQDAESRCYAWALMPNHVHLFVRTGKKPLSKMMQSLLSGYGQYFNGKHRRRGYVYEGRFKSVLCQEERYFQVLVGYIHLNPLKAGLVRGLQGLGRYAWTGHKALMGGESLGWQDTHAVLSRFGKRKGSQRRGYLAFLKDYAGEKVGNQLGGSELIRVLTGIWGDPAEGKKRSRLGDERILGDESFVEKMLEKAEEHQDRRRKLRQEGWSIPRVSARAAEAMGLKPGEVRGASKERRKSQARALACKWGVEDLGYTTVAMSQFLRIGQPTVTEAVKRGRMLEKSLRVRMNRTPRRRIIRK